MAPEVPSICVPPRGRLYGRGRLEDLRADLVASARSTLVLELSDPAQLRLGASGATADGYRLTQTGLRQACNVLSPGLHALVSDLSGARREPARPGGLYSCREALAVFNMVLTRRFSATLADRYSIVTDTAGRTIDGLAGPRFQLLEHSRFLELALESAAAEGRDCEFLEAALGDRRLAFRVLDRSRLLADRRGASWFAGIHFANSELGGEQPAAGSSLLVQPRSRLHALGPARRGRTIHTGRDLEGRLARTLAAVAADRPAAAVMAARFDAMSDRPLRLPPDQAGREREIGRLASRLARRKLSRRLAVRAVIAAVHGLEDDRSPAWSGGIIRGGIDDSSVFDLYKSVLSMAQSRGQSAREEVERVGWTILMHPSV